MASKSHVHAARNSPVPGLVVIVLAVAAIFFGLAIVKPRARNDALEVEFIRLRASLEALQERTAALEQQLLGAQQLRR